MAWVAMAQLSVWGSAILFGCLTSPRAAELVSDIAPIMTIFVVPLTAIVLAYYGVSTVEHRRKR